MAATASFLADGSPVSTDPPACGSPPIRSIGALRRRLIEEKPRAEVEHLTAGIFPTRDSYRERSPGDSGHPRTPCTLQTGAGVDATGHSSSCIRPSGHDACCRK